MRRTIDIEQHSIEIDTSMGWLFVYRGTFGRDILPDLMPMVEAVVAGLGEVFGTAVVKSDKSIDPEKVMELMDADAFVDMFVKLSGMELTTVLQIFWAMARNADPTVAPPETFYRELEKFPMDEVVPTLFYAIVESSVSSKNAESLLAKLRERIPSLSMWSPSQESTEG